MSRRNDALHDDAGAVQMLHKPFATISAMIPSTSGSERPALRTRRAGARRADGAIRAAPRRAGSARALSASSKRMIAAGMSRRGVGRSGPSVAPCRRGPAPG